MVDNEKDKKKIPAKSEKRKMGSLKLRLLVNLKKEIMQNSALPE